MIQAATLPLVGNRWTPFFYEIAVTGISLTGVLFAMDIRLTYDAPGAPLVFLGTVVLPDEGVGLTYNATATVAEHIAAGRITKVPPGMSDADSLPLLIIGIQIDEETMQGLPFPSERGNDAVLYYDLHVTPSGGVKQVWFRGTFTVRAGATQ